MDIKYIGYYDLPERKENRNYVLAAVNKMEYIISALEKTGHTVSVVSAAKSFNKRGAKSEILALSEKSKLYLFGSMPYVGAAGRKISVFLFYARFFLYLLKNIKSSDTVIVYHSLGYYRLISLVHRLKGFNLILEVEEIYGDVIQNKKASEKELEFFKTADKYIFPTELLNEKINTDGKPYAVIYGTYQVEEQKICKKEYRNSHTWDENKIHCVYAGTFDPRKGGAIAAAAAEFLPCQYHIHILGFGSDAERKNMQDLISNLAEKCECSITYDGLLSGEEYIQFIQSCDIGLSTQNPNADFNATSFPSKILSYMANGLRVVSIRIPAIERSAVGGYIYYYDKQAPQEIAKAISSVDINDEYDGKKVIAELDKKFRSDIKKLLEK